jgi:FkbH-like protein
MHSPRRFDSQDAKPTDSVAAHLLSQAADRELIPVVNSLLQSTQAYDRNVLDACLASFETRGLVASKELEVCLAEESEWRKGATGLWLTAKLLELRGPAEQALRAWAQVVGRHQGPVPEARLSRARLLSQSGRLPEAFSELCEAISDSEEYTFLSKAARLYDQLRKRGEPSCLRRTRLAILSSTAMDLLAPLIKLTCFRDEIDAELYVAPYGNFRQEILNPSSGLYAFRPDIVLIATHWRDANLPSFSNTPEAEIARVLSEFRKLWEILLERNSCRVIQHNFDVPAIDSYGHLSLSMPGGRACMLRELNRRVPEVAPSSVIILDLDQVSAKFGKQDWFDPSYWHLAKQYPCAKALPLLVDQQAALMRAALGLSKKVVVVDLDNTLWGGIIGEDGLEGISLGAPSAAGEAYQAFQRYLLDLKSRGVLLAVCSKNNEEDAKLPFLKHDSMVLHLEDFVVFRANWRDKPENLRAIAELLNLGLDSFVFLDDNPVERALVRRELPQVAVPEIGSDPSRFVLLLDRKLYFEALTLSREDKERQAIYRADALRDELKTTAASLEDFLRSLEMQVEMGPFNETVLARVVQLIGKTNQFNLTSRRHPDQEVRRMMASTDHWTQYFRLTDRFGDNGLIGVMIARKDATGASLWEIDTWLMSCRVIGRQIEEFMLRTLVAAAKASGVRTIRGIYSPAAKNVLVRDLYLRMGFAKLQEKGDGSITYALDVANWPTISCKFIQTISHAMSGH